MVNQDLEDIRREYTAGQLSKLTMASHPLVQFELWMDEALQVATLLDPTAATLSTVDEKGLPSSRIILVKDVVENGFIFFTNYNSKKGQNLNNNPHASLLFYWDALHRQIRIQGTVSKIDSAQSDAYFAKRPKESQIAASISNQSAPIASRSALEKKFLDAHTADNAEVSRPAHWGGYLLTPTYFEFWQGRPNRLHDRISYEKTDTHWSLTRLQP